MELDLDRLLSGQLFGLATKQFQAKFTDASLTLRQNEGLRQRGALINDRDPIAFAGAFFACVQDDWPIILSNPSWSQLELDQLNKLCRPHVCFGNPLMAEKLPDDCYIPLDPGVIAIPTGGTTSGVKLAVHRWSTLAASAEGTRAFLGLGPIDSYCQLPLFHVSGLMQLVRSYLSGGSIHFSETSPNGMCISFVPTQLARVLLKKELVHAYQKAATIFVGGAALSADLRKAALQADLPIIPVYGMTETAAMCAAIKTEDLRRGVRGAEGIGDAQFAADSDGCITIESSALFLGYLGRKAREPGPYTTGDVGHVDSDRRLYITGRADRLINTGGEKVDPAEIEAVINRIEGVDDCAVLGVPDPKWGERVVAFVVSKSRENDDIQKQLEGTLAHYKRPKQIFLVDAIPTNVVGKTDYAVLRVVTL